MRETSCVREWTHTIWVKAETKARYEDLALTHHLSPSELAQQALEAYRPDATVAATVTDTDELRALMRAELAQLTTDVAATVTDTVTDTVMAKLPALVQDVSEVVQTQ